MPRGDSPAPRGVHPMAKPPQNPPRQTKEDAGEKALLADPG